MILITSAEYINQELAIEYGKIPPAFLPVGNKRLFVHQLELLRDLDKEIFLSVPSDYIIEDLDLELLNSYDVKIIGVNKSLSINKSINYCLNFIGDINSNLIIFHGDTLFSKKIEILPDSILVYANNNVPKYDWGYDSSLEKFIYSGVFCFKSINFLKNLLIIKRTFEEVVEEYDKHKFLKKINNQNWLDFGHITTFYKNKGKINTTRLFNSSSTDEKIFYKYSNDINKLNGEINWYKENYHSLYSPKLLEYGEGFYGIEYIPLPMLNDLYIFGNHKEDTWREILISCRDYLMEMSSTIKKLDSYNNYESIYYKKTLERISLIEREIFPLNKKIIFNGVDTSITLDLIINNCLNNLSPITYITKIHGDFHFGNIFYNFRNNTIKTIDPRGLDGDGNITVYGDPRYDVAKLAHSILGGYDYIISDYQKCLIIYKQNDLEVIFKKIEKNNFIINVFKEIFSDYDFYDVINITILLFISMIPLHKECISRQKAMVGTAIYLYLEYLK